MQRIGVFLTVVVFGVRLSSAQELRPERDALQPVYATIWMQSSGEYSGACLQTYAMAARIVEAKSAEAKMKVGTKPLAVVMDLDETVLDNSKYQSFVIDSGMPAEPESFSAFVSAYTGAIGLVPGAKKFVTTMRGDGITVVFVSNRSQEIQQATLETLRAHALATKNMGEQQNDELLLKARDERDKTKRFARAQEKYHVLAWFGDNLGDFPVSFEVPKGAPLDARRKKVEELEEKFGTEWFVLPNPVYGDWTKNLSPDPRQDLLRARK